MDDQGLAMVNWVNFGPTHWGRPGSVDALTLGGDSPQ